MKFKGTSDEDTCSDPLLPPSTDEGQTASAAGDNVDDSDEKSLLTDVPLNLEQLAMIHNRQISPPYKGKLSLNGVWSTEILQECPGTPRMITQNKRRLGLLRLLHLLIVALGVYYCVSATYTLLENDRMVQKLHSVLWQVTAIGNPVKVNWLSHVPSRYEGRLIHIVGRINVTAPLSYEECGVSARSVKVKRVYHKSRQINRAEFKPYFPGDSWLNMPPVKEKFCSRNYVDQESIVDDEKIADVAKIGPLVLGDQLKKKFDLYHLITEKLQMINQWNAYRVTYSDTGRNGVEYSIVGILVNDTLEAHELPGVTMISETDIRPYMISDRIWDHINTLNAEKWYSYVKIATLFSLTVVLYFIGSLAATMKKKRIVKFSMPVQ